MTIRLAIVFLLSIFFQDADSQIYVSRNGSDRAEGSKNAPLASVHAALRKAREWRRLQLPAAQNAIHIFVSEGLYDFSEPLFIRPEDGGTSPLFIEALPNEEVVFSGGVQIKGWKKSTAKNLPARAKGHVWVANAPTVGESVLNFRQLWVNNVKAIRARDKDADSMYRILSWDHQSQSCWIPKPSVDIAGYADLEMVIHQWWAIANLRVKSATPKGDSVLLRFQQPESRIQSEHPWPAPWISKETGNSAFYLTNAIGFLDHPGEWYLDKTAHKLYYWPRTGEDLSTATVIAPALETLVRIEGSADRPVSNINFSGISFQHTTWLRPSEQGHVPHQAGMYMLDAYKLKVPGTPDKKTLENQAWVGRPAASVIVNNASNVSFVSCTFEHLASTGLDFGKGVQRSQAGGNIFKDIGGAAILAGHFSDEATEVHLPYNPKDERELTSYLTINNNLVNDVANEDWGCVGIGAGYVSNTVIEHNDLSELPYTGISLGWGWTPTKSAMNNNRIIANKIQRYGRQLYDVAGIYTLGAQPGTLIAENYIDSVYKAPYAHLPSHWFYLYTDEGSSFISVTNNWTPSEKFLQNANGPGNEWMHNGPMVSAQIKNQAGLQASYQGLLQHRTVSKHWPVVHELPVIIELIAKKGSSPELPKLQTLLKENKINSPLLYQWQNHYVVYEKVRDVSVLKSKLQKAFPDIEIKVYYDVVYEFNRQHCTDTSTAGEWTHTILTADLVANPKLQKEYVDYHRTQFEKWPEVAKGFCNASFQQLLVFRNGRQLMLVISVPRGQTLEQLNPRTTENNPRVNDWNNLMKKYQEGIEGTKPGEVWVELKQL